MNIKKKINKNLEPETKWYIHKDDYFLLGLKPWCIYKQRQKVIKLDTV
jgi:hypothetical protein